MLNVAMIRLRDSAFLKHWSRQVLKNACSPAGALSWVYLINL